MLQFKVLLSLGGYGVYIWPCYLAFVAAFVMHLMFACKRYKSIRQRIHSSFNNE